MEVNSDFEERIARLEHAVAELTGRMDNRSAAGPRPVPRVQPKPHAAAQMAAAEPAASRGADWWLARAGAALTVLALILLYQYAVGHGWITPVVRVITGTAIGAALMYWGRKLEPASNDAAFPVALRELMMGSALAAWYVSAYAASVLYQLIELPTARLVYLAITIVGGLLALNERRALLAIVAIGTGFATPALLSSPSGSIPGYVLFLSVVGGLGAYLYLMRGWQSILWMSFFSMWGSVAGAIGTLWSPAFGAHPFSSSRLSLTLLILATTYVFVRAPVMRRRLVATGADRYPEPIRSLSAANWLRETGNLFKYISSHAGASDSFSVWIITLAAPIAGISLLASTWHLGGYVWGALAVVAAAAALLRFMSSSETDKEVEDVSSAAAILWSLAGFISIGHDVALSAGLDAIAVPLGTVAVYSIVIVTFLSPPRFFTALAVGRLLAGLVIAVVAFTELSALGGAFESKIGLSAGFGIAETLAIAAALITAREMFKHVAAKEIVIALALTAYATFLLADARILGHVWSPLVTATYAIAGTALLVRGRLLQSKIMQRTGGATIALVIGRLLFVDLVGVDTIWRVLLFLGCGALFLYTSHQMQNTAKQPPPGVA